MLKNVKKVAGVGLEPTQASLRSHGYEPRMFPVTTARNIF